MLQILEVLTSAGLENVLGDGGGGGKALDFALPVLPELTVTGGAAPDLPNDGGAIDFLVASLGGEVLGEEVLLINKVLNCSAYCLWLSMRRLSCNCMAFCCAWISAWSFACISIICFWFSS